MEDRSGGYCGPNRALGQKCIYSPSLELLRRAEDLLPHNQSPRLFVDEDLIRRKLAKAKERQCFTPIDETGKLRFPPRECVVAHEIELKKKKERNRAAGDQPENCISLRQLRDKYCEDEEDEGEEDDEMLFSKRRKRIDSAVAVECALAEMRALERRQADLPRDIESQFEEMWNLYKKEEQSRKIWPEQLETIENLKTQCRFPVVPYDRKNTTAVEQRIVGKLRQRSDFMKKLRLVEGEIIEYYEESMRWSIVDHLLKDSRQRAQLGISATPIEIPIFLIRAPVPWHQSKITATNFMRHDLFVTNEISREIRYIWHDRYEQMVVVRMDALGELPVPALELMPRVESLCSKMRHLLLTEWLASVAELFLERKRVWACLFDAGPTGSVALVKNFFRSIDGLLSRQVRSLILASLRHLRDFLRRYSEGNYFPDEYRDLTFIETPFVTLPAETEFTDGEVHCRPSVMDMRNVLLKCFIKIIDVATDFPSIQNVLFPEIREMHYLPPVSRHEDDVSRVIDEALACVSANEPGPKLYLHRYLEHEYLLDGSAERSLQDFMKSEPAPFLRDFGAKIKEFDQLRKQMFLFSDKIPLNLVELDCTALNERLREALHQLRSHVCENFLQEVRAINSKACASFDEIAERISGMPEATREVVELYNYLLESRDSSLFMIKSELSRSAELIIFLVGQQAEFTEEDLQLNARAFTWPRDMENVMELAANRLNMRKEFVEGQLKGRRQTFDTQIAALDAKIDAFKRKDPAVLTLDEMKNSCQEIEVIAQEMRETEKEAEDINTEESLLDLEVSPYLSLPTMSSTVNTFDLLWHTVLSFNRNYDTWMYGPFQSLDAELVREETDSAWKILYKLSRTLAELPAARRIAEMTRGKVDKFKQFLPLLASISNPGLKPRHWLAIGEAAGGITITPKPDSSLSQMIELGLQTYSARLEEISGAASKEHALESNLVKMRDEWCEVSFELSPYRETGVKILAGVDDIQVLLDDHILKAQTMRGSPYVKAFEAEMQAWEEKLITMQDIIDQWLSCQATWMYLEPIFSSEDIMRQMPTEAKNFRIVDKTWRTIMAHVDADHHVLAATDMPNMLKLFRESNMLLEDIQKGLNDYLEKKRLFFPRLV
ncbi:hypothetical protein QAD02_005939 [Eretmocerus hayati]|uniref:Uncharacterized protein n=1 Tax=Eretmocerus hayati TaxID=131215 RepID=A0ACC2MZT3_9HYME|nr:hypothetical protein QAD02_005939 [Eretmocerus hayati]